MSYFQHFSNGIASERARILSAGLKPAIALLVIDDNPVSVEMISNAVAQPGLEILQASDPEEDLHLFRYRRPQIVLTDLAQRRPRRRIGRCL